MLKFSIIVILTILVTALLSYIYTQYQLKHQNEPKKKVTIIIVVIGILVAMSQNFLYDIIKPSNILPQYTDENIEANETITIDSIPFDGWSPDRQTFSYKAPASYPVFNSIIDSNIIGDERNFIRIREAVVREPYEYNRMYLKAGREYEVSIYFHNNASDDLNESGRGMANDVRMRTMLPGFVEKGEVNFVSAEISSSNTIPASVRDEIEIVAEQDAYLRYVPGSAVIHSNGSVNEQNLPFNDLFSEKGTPIGYSDNYWGSIAGGVEYAGSVTYRFVVDMPSFEISKEVSRDAENQWVENITIIPGDILDFRIRYKNTGTTEQNDVIFFDKLPEGLIYLPQTTYIINRSTDGRKSISDNLFSNGINVGRYQPGSSVTIGYKAQVLDNDEIFPYGITKIYNEARVATANGTMIDSVEICVAQSRK